MEYRGTLAVGWHDLDRAVDLLAAQLLSKIIGTHDWVLVGRPRGGLVLAVCLSHRLELPLISECYVSTDYKVIWVDDILDSGRTLERARFACSAANKFLPCFWTAREKWKEHNYLVATYVPEDRWVVFPWEVQNESRTRT